VPRSSISRNSLFITPTSVHFVGRTIDFRCAGQSAVGGVKNVRISIALVVGSGASAAASKCRFLTKSGTLSAPRSCKSRILLGAKLGKRRAGKVPWTFRMRHLHLPSGTYLVDAFGTDSQNNKERTTKRFNEKRFVLH